MIFSEDAVLLRVLTSRMGFCAECESHSFFFFGGGWGRVMYFLVRGVIRGDAAEPQDELRHI